MTLTLLQQALGWSVLINWGILLVWAMCLLFAHDWVYRVHGLFFRISEESFDQIHYTGMAFYKILVLVLNLVPYLALLIIL